MSTDLQPPDIGQMRLYDAVHPALDDGDYHLTIRTDISRDDLPLDPNVPPPYRFTVSGPRFTLPATEVAAVHPPRNAQSTAFSDLLPHIALSRRTLPWERAVDSPDHPIPEPTQDLDDPPPTIDYPAPWLALLLFIDDPAQSEVQVISEVPLSTVVDAPTLGRLAGATGTEVVDAIEADGALLRQIMPSKDEVRLLCHARQVNTLDRELSAGGSDGWFAVVMANRLPTAGFRHRACLVSIEQRSDLILPEPPSADSPPPALPARVRLVLLYSWTFTVPALTVPGLGSLKELMENLSSGVFGADTPADPTQSGHVTLDLRDRTGSEQTVWYRGPLAPVAIARDTLGPYHSADQAWRLLGDTSAHDISYAAALETGRLLAAADARLAQELMRWRREDYHTAARTSVADAVYGIVPEIEGGPSAGVATGMTAPVSVTALERASSGAGTSADTTGAETVSSAPGLDVARLAAAWSIPVAHAASLLGVKPPAPAQAGDVPAIPMTAAEPEAEPAPAPVPALTAASPEDPAVALRRQRLALIGITPQQSQA